MINRICNFINKNIMIFIFAFCIYTAFLSFFIVYSNKIILENVDAFKDIQKKSFNLSSEKYNIEIHYPITKNNSVNTVIKNFIDSCINRLTNDTKYYIPKNSDDKFHLIINYQIRRASKDIASFIFLINYSDSKNTNNIKIITTSYNMKFSREIRLNSFFCDTPSNMAFLCKKSKEYFIKSKNIDKKILNYFIDDITNSNEKSFDGYAFSSKYLSIFFNSNKLSSKYNKIYEVKIPWNELTSILKSNIYIN